jgi:hypothetical protein
MNQAIPCPHCGKIGYHAWTGGGACPGTNRKEARPCPYCGCIGYHTWAGEGTCPGANIQDEAYSEALNEIKQLKALLLRAADALEDLRGPGWKRELIAELRKAAW